MSNNFGITLGLPTDLREAVEIAVFHLHEAFDRQKWIAPGKSRESCVLVAHTLREYFGKLGFEARVRPVCLIMRAFQGDQELHSLGIGMPTRIAKQRGYWNGHMIVTIADKYLIDGTLDQARRPAWRNCLPTLFAGPMHPADERQPLFDMPMLFGMEQTSPDEPGFRFEIAWLDRPDNMTWKGGPDTARERRKSAVQYLLNAYRNSRFKAGDRVRIKYKSQVVNGIIAMVSRNQQSIGLLYEGVINGHHGAMAARKSGAGYRSLQDDTEIQITKREDW